VQQVAEGIHRGLEMPEAEQVRRMQRMREVVREHNVYQWAAHLLSDVTEIRIDLPEWPELSQNTASESAAHQASQLTRGTHGQKPAQKTHTRR